MPKEHLYVLVYLVTVMHSVQAGYMEKAQKYTDKALMQIEKLKSKFKKFFDPFFTHIQFMLYKNYITVVDNKPILSTFQLMLLEHIIMCHLVMGNKSQALQEISTVVNLCRQNPRLLECHWPQVHTLLGLYSMNMNCMEAAEAQFMVTLNVSQIFH